MKQNYLSEAEYWPDLLGWFSNRMQNGNVSWRRRAQIKQLAWPMVERQIGDRKSSLVLSARFPVAKWRSRSVAKSAYYLPLDSRSLPI